LTHAVERGSEGVILKQHDSTYQIDRRSETWTKIKPEYLEEFGENVDLVVIGRERSKKDKYFCGLRVTANDTESYKDPKFYSFCRVANGFDSDDYRKIDDLTRGKWKDMKSDPPPSNLVQFGKRIPPEWIDPRDSFVLEVKARSIDRSLSKNYKTSTTLYNAYSRQIRIDKSWDDSTTVEDYRKIKSNRKSTSDKDQKLLNRKKRKILNQLQKQSIDEENWNDSVSSIRSSIFEGLTFMVISDSFHGNKRLTISEISTILKQNGANITKNQRLVEEISKLRIISDKRTIEARELYRDGFDIIKSLWVFDCLKNQRVIKVEPKHCYDVGFELMMQSNQRVNSFEIGYLNKSSMEELEAIFQKVLKDEDSKDEEHVKIETDASAGQYSFEEISGVLQEISLLSGYKIFLVNVNDPVTDADVRILKNKIEMNDGTVVDSVRESNLIVALNSGEESVVQKIVEIRKELAKDLKFSDEDHVVKTKRIVTSEWVTDSISNGIQVDQQDYPVITPRS
jgi:DNA ligase-4